MAKQQQLLLQQQQCPPRVVCVLSSLLEAAVSRNEKRLAAMAAATRVTVFHGLRAPGISIAKYVERIFKYASCSPACFVVAYAYMDRFIQQRPDVPITSLNVHRLLITSVMLAAKFLDDACYNNAYYAKVGGVTTAEMNRLELEFLFCLNFRLQVTVSVFESYCSRLERQVEQTQIHRPLFLLQPCNNKKQQHKFLPPPLPQPQEQQQQQHQQQQEHAPDPSSSLLSCRGCYYSTSVI